MSPTPWVHVCSVYPVWECVCVSCAKAFMGCHVSLLLVWSRVFAVVTANPFDPFGPTDIATDLSGLHFDAAPAPAPAPVSSGDFFSGAWHAVGAACLLPAVVVCLWGFHASLWALLSST